MANKKRIWLIILALVVVGVLAYFFMKPAATETQESKVDENLITFNGANLQESKDGKIIWSLKAEKILFDPKTKNIYLTNFTGTFNKDDVSMTVTAPEAKLTNQQKNLEMHGGVKATSTDGAEFTSPSFYYNTVTKKFTSKEPFTFKKGHDIITADEMEGDLVLEQVKAMGHAKLTQEE